MLRESLWTGLVIICIGPMMDIERPSALPDWKEPPRLGRHCWKGTCHTLEPLLLTPLTGEIKGKKEAKTNVNTVNFLCERLTIYAKLSVTGEKHSSKQRWIDA